MQINYFTIQNFTTFTFVNQKNCTMTLSVDALTLSALYKLLYYFNNQYYVC